MITIMGTEEGCEAAKKLVLARVEELENTIEKDFPISEYKYVKEMKAQQMKVGIRKVDHPSLLASS